MAKRLQKVIRPSTSSRFATTGTPSAFTLKVQALLLRWRSWLPQVLVILAVTLWIYRPSIHGGWIWDDNWYITTNPLLRDLSGLGKLWFQPGSWVEYYPIGETVQWFQWQYWGRDTLDYHLTNVFLHVVNALLVWRLLAKFELRLAWLGGLLFAVHPVQVESVAYISELKNALSLPFFLMSMCCWIDYEESRKKEDYVAALVLFLVAMLCKITMAPFPVLILVYAWWKRSRIDGRDVKVSIPFFVISLLLGLMTIWVGGLYEAANHGQPLDVPMGGFFTRLARAGILLGFYFSACFLPIHLAPVYPLWPINPASLAAYLPCVVFAGMLIWMWRKRRSWRRHVLLGFAFFALMLAPFVGFDAVSYMAESWVELHLLYLPLIGLIGLVVAGLEDLRAKLPLAARPMTIAAVAVATLAFAADARAYSGWFINENVFWSRAIQSDPQSWLPHHDLGCLLLDQDRYPEAETQLMESVRLNPGYSDGHYNLGLAMGKLGKMDEAEAQYREAIRLNSNNARAYLSLGESQLKSGHQNEAEGFFRQGLKIAPDDPFLCTNLGGILMQTGRLGEAVGLYEEAIKVNPDVARLQYNLGIALLQADSLPDSAQHLDAAVRLDPQFVAAHQNFGVVLARLGHLPEAVTEFETVLRLDPQAGKTRDNLALALAQMGRLDEAIAQFQQALRVDPQDERAREAIPKLQQLERQQNAPAKN